MDEPRPALRAARRIGLAVLCAALLNCSPDPPEGFAEAPADSPEKAAGQTPEAIPDPLSELPLRPAEPRSLTLDPAGRRLFPVDLGKGDYLRVYIEQLEGDAAITLHGPEGAELLQINSPDGAQTVEALHYVAARSGTYKISVAAPLEQLKAGRCRIWIEDLRPARQLDQAAFAAFQLQIQADEQYRQASPQALQAALESYRQAAELWGQCNQKSEQASALKQMGAVYGLQGQTEQKLDHYEQALQMFREIGDSRQEADLLNDIGALHFHKGELKDAVQAWQKALGIAEQGDDAAGKASLLNSLGVYYRSQGQVGLALVFYGQALQLNQLLGRRLAEASVLENMAVLQAESGNYPLALDYLNSALKIFRSLKRPGDEAYILTRIGWLKHLRKEYPQAIELYKQAIAVRGDTQDALGKAASLAHLAAAYGAMHDTEQAFRNYQLSLQIARQAGYAASQAAILTSLGELFLNAGDPGRALPYLSQATALYQGSQEPSDQAHVQFLYARAERSFGHLATAKDLAEKVLSAVEELRSRSPGSSLRADFWASRYDYIEFYIDLLMQMDEQEPASGYAVEAFVASQRSRARGLQEALSKAAAVGSAPDPALLERLNALDGQIRRLIRRWASSDSLQTGDLIDGKLHDLLLQRDLLQHDIRAGQTSLVTSLTDPDPIRLQRIQNELLDKDTLLLAYSLGTKRSFLWVVDSQGLTSHILPPRETIERLAQDLYDYLASNRTLFVKDRLGLAAAGLGQMLLGEITGRLGEKRLLIAADGILHVIPFNVLAPDRGEIPAQPLIVKHEIVNLPSVPVLSLLRRQQAARPSAPKAVAVWADPVFSASDDRLQSPPPQQQASAHYRPPTFEASLLWERSGDPDLTSLERLPASRQEADAILAMVAPGQSFQAFDFEASRESVLSAPLDQYRILHFATHGLLYPRLSGISGIVFSLLDETGAQQDGFLPAHEIYNLKLNADLVVVSACKSALGRRLRGEGVVGLTQGFLYAGAARVVVSLWNVHDYATAQLMENFYHNMLRERMKPAAALRQAQRDMRKIKHFARPYFWAGFTLQGEWN